MTAVLAGDVHIAGGEYLGLLPIESMDKLRSSDEVEVMTGDGSTNYLLQTNFRRAPWNDVNVRKAMNLAIDRKTISDTVFDGLAKPATGVLPANVPFVEDTGSDAYRFDAKKAAELLQGAGWVKGSDGVLAKDGQRLAAKMIVNETVFPQAKTLSELVQAQLREVGFDLGLEILDYDAYLARIEAGDYDIATNITWGAPYDPHSSVVALFKGSGASDTNLVYTDDKMRGLVDAALASGEADRAKAYLSLWDYADEVAAAVPLLSSSRAYAVNTSLQGFSLAATEYDLDVTALRIER